MSKFEDKLFELKIQKSKQILIGEIKRHRSKIAVVWTTGRDSTCLLYLMKDIYGEVPIPVLFPDTGFHFKETYGFRDKIAKLFELSLINVRPTKSYDEMRGDRELCCYMLKVEPVLRAMEKQKFKALISPLRWSAPRTFTEGHIPETSIDKMPLPFRTIKPIAHWTKKDALRFTEERKIPLNSLYTRGYQSVFCKICKFHPLEEKEIYNVKDTEKILKRLQSLGYF